MNKTVVGIVGGVVVIAAGFALYSSANHSGNSGAKSSSSATTKVSGKVDRKSVVWERV